jgi:hypothetical protein
MLQSQRVIRVDVDNTLLDPPASFFSLTWR